MQTEPKKYKIKKADTLTSVSRQLGLEPQVLKNYHNAYCSLEDLIGHDFPKHVSEILIPPQNGEANIQLAGDIKEGGRLLNRSKTFLRVQSYWVENTKGEEKRNEFIKELEINLKKQARFYEIAVTIRKSDINKDREDWLQMEAIAHIMAEIYKNIVMKISFKGELWDVLNVREIQYNWAQAKKQLLKRNGNSPDDKITQFIIETINEEVKYSERIANSLQYDYLYQFLLKSIRNKLYREGYKSESVMAYPYFFAHPAEKIGFKEQLKSVKKERKTVFFETTATPANEMEDTEFVREYIADKLSDKLDISEEMMKNIPDSMKKQLKEKEKSEVEVIDISELQFLQEGKLAINRQTGMLHALDYTVSTSYKDRYKKEYGIKIDAINQY